ncbi:tumor necrosis factor receptor superfamily member 1A isoform X1 [Oreochromis niloticus]|uniref:tumor necrosis factor receptor superfamily member 1A isoform X1 n=1 Tax=Oreochromis niloticus TaxID=8128 RepID=UPI000DF249F5|nr:tumor necrosis factor receptor superfamily member 1A isoform X1 [Oreochromis niloticus]
MDLIFVFPLILALISCGQSHTEGTEQTNGSCYNLCPAGYHKVGNCDDQVKKYKCKKCEVGFYTDIENYREKCLRCDLCNRCHKGGTCDEPIEKYRFKRCGKRWHLHGNEKPYGEMSSVSHVFVFPLILALTSCGQSHTEGIEQTDGSCYNLCPAGYHKVGNCDDQVKKYKCKKCEDGFYTDIENYREKCLRCEQCNHDEVVIEPCIFNRSIVCGCKEGYYNSGSDSLQCSKCSCEHCPHNADYKAKCSPPSSYRQKPTTASTNPSTTRIVSSTTVANKRLMPTTVTPASTSTPDPNKPLVSTSKATTKTSNPHITEIPRNPGSAGIFLAVISFLLLSWFLLICTMKIFKHKDSFCWRRRKEAEVSQNEQPSHQGSNPTTLTLTVSEETPMLTLNQSPAISEHPTHINPLVPVNGQLVARQHDHADRWPAIVLYAIIKEVPLHRWKEFLRLLKVTDQQMVRVEMETGFSLGSMEKQYQMLRLWSQHSSSKLSDIFSALHYMELSGCAQLLQESLEQLQWTPDHRQALTAI